MSLNRSSVSLAGNFTGILGSESCELYRPVTGDLNSHDYVVIQLDESATGYFCPGKLEWSHRSPREPESTTGSIGLRSNPMIDL